MEKNEILLKKAKAVLNGNWTGNFTKPSSRLYPYQWNWDSGFIAIGYANYDSKRAEKELLSLFKGQWKNGMMPHIIFNEKEKGYFPGPDYWNIEISKDAPKNKLTSGITQPPMQAIAAYKIYEKSKNKKETKKFLKKIYPKILNFHRYLYNERDPEKSGLATIIHPWESGFDNSPRWDKPLSRIKPKNLPKYKRMDLEHVGCDCERPTNKDYDKYIYLLEIMKKHKYNVKKFYDEFPFKIKDIVFNSILYVANKNLKEIGEILNKDTSEIKKWEKRANKHFIQYTCPHPKSECLFYDYDIVADKRITKRSVSSLIPLYTGVLDKKMAKIILNWLTHAHYCGDGTCKYSAVPTIDIHSPYFTSVTYWRGPIWVNVNWLIYHGLREYKYYDRAKEIKDAITKLITDHGFYEYFDPLKGDGIGGNNFSWTAALLIDLLMEK